MHQKAMAAMVNEAIEFGALMLDEVKNLTIEGNLGAAWGPSANLELGGGFSVDDS